MKKVVFSSRSDKKMDLLIQLAKEIGVKIETKTELTDEDMALPGPKVSRKLFDEWLAKDDGEEYTPRQAEKIIKQNIKKQKSAKNGHRI